VSTLSRERKRERETTVSVNISIQDVDAKRWLTRSRSDENLTTVVVTIVTRSCDGRERKRVEGRSGGKKRRGRIKERDRRPKGEGIYMELLFTLHRYLTYLLVK
jgi:hypothetical protein